MTEQELLEVIERAAREKWTKLDLLGKGLTALPPEIGKLAKLRALALYENQLATLPPEIGNLANLQILGLEDNQLVALPPEIGKLANLRALFLHNNNLTALPPEIGKLAKLQSLDLFFNELTALPPEIGNLANLQGLYVRYNQLTALPPEFGNLVNLEELYLSGNALTALPPEIGNLANLQRLDLDRNQLTALPPEIQRLSNLKALYLHGNEKLGISPEILGPTLSDVVDLEKQPAKPADILRFYFQTTRARTLPLNEAKVLLVGQGAVGKTSLVNYLVHNKKCTGRESKTKGIRITRWAVEGKRKGRADRVQLNVWDFGGQEIMHATHQFFLTQRSLYLVVLGARQGENESRLEYWLKIIQSFGADSPIIVVVNKSDEHALSLDQTGLLRKYAPQLKGFVETSCVSGKGIAPLRKMVRDEILRLPHVGDKLPAAWFEIKDKLAAMEKDWISYGDYESLCGEKGIEDGADRERLVRFLHDLGIVLNYRGDIRLQDTNILKPEWVTQGVYAILNDEDLTRRGGVLEMRRLSAILDAKKYPRDKHEFIVGMMRKFELCFEFADSGGTFLIPELLAVNEPEYVGKWDETTALNFQYQYNVLPTSVISRFIVRTHLHLNRTKPIYWRSGVVLEIDGAEALVRSDSEDRRITISVRGPVPQRRNALTAVRMQFEHIHGTISEIGVVEFVPLAEEPAELLPYKTLRAVEDAGRRTYTHVTKSGKIVDVDVSGVLNGIEDKWRRVRGKMGRMGGAGGSVFISYAHKDRSKWLEPFREMMSPLVREGILDVWWDGQIKPSEQWRSEIAGALDRTAIGLLLVSPAFMASDFIQTEELTYLLEAAETRGVAIFWVLLEPAIYETTPLTEIQAAHDISKPLNALPDSERTAAIKDVCMKIAREAGWPARR